MPSLNGTRCTNQTRLFGFLWYKRCRGTLTVKQSLLRPGQFYSICNRCDDVTWPLDSEGRRVGED